MARAIERIKDSTFGHAALHGTVRQAASDGDTIQVDLLGHVGVRLFSIDAPELHFNLPQQGGADPKPFVSLGNPDWDAFLNPQNTFSNSFGLFSGPNGDQTALAALGQPLIDDLTPRLGSRANHFAHAEAAERFLEARLEADENRRKQAGEEFKFFMRFAHETMDRYGRMLCYLHLDQTQAQRAAEGTLPSYNVQLLEAGVAIPYFIWPNLDPSRAQGSLVDAVPSPHNVQGWIAGLPRLRAARQAAAAARANARGVYSNVDGQRPLRLLPYELRFLAGRRTPTRRVLNLDPAIAGTDQENKLLHANNYFTISKLEDRLFVDDHFVPLFQRAGFALQ